MEQSGLFDLELSLFNGDLQLVGLDSTTPAAEPLLFNETSEITAPLLPDATGSDLALKGTQLTPEVAISDISGCDVLDAAWLSTRVDLQLLQALPSQEQPVDLVASKPPMENLTPVVIEAQTSEAIVDSLAIDAPINHLPITQASLDLTAGDLFDSMISAAPQGTPQEDLFIGDGDINAENLLLEVLGKLTDQFSPSGSSDFVDKDSVLSPVSVEDVEYFLSSPSSPAESSTSSWSDAKEDCFTEPVRTSRSRKRKCYESDVSDEVTDKKLRKKIQNKTAALRYRQKKKAEKGNIVGECEILENRNAELRNQVDSISREINYLKNLMNEVKKAKGLRQKVQ